MAGVCSFPKTSWKSIPAYYSLFSKKPKTVGPGAASPRIKIWEKSFTLFSKQGVPWDPWNISNGDDKVLESALGSKKCFPFFTTQMGVGVDVPLNMPLGWA